MDKVGVDLEKLKEDWLVSNSVVAFAGAVLMAEAWRPSDAKNVIPILNVTLPLTPEVVVLSIIAFLAIVSFGLAVTSAVAPVRTWAIYHVSPYSHFLEILMWMSFTFSLVSAIPKLPANQWWSGVLVIGGLALGLSIVIRWVLRPLIPLAQSFVRYLRGLALRAWNRFVASRRKSADAEGIDQE